MAELEREPDRNGLALIIVILGTAFLYVLLVIVIIGLPQSFFNEGAMGQLGKWAVYWAAYMLPQIIAPWIAVKVANGVAQPYNRPLVYYILCFVLIVAFVGFSLTVLFVGGWNGIALTLLQGVTLLLAWLAIRRAINIAGPRA